MVNLRYRSTQKELLDEDGIPFEVIKKNMQELNRINTLLGGHNITLKGFKEILKSCDLTKKVHVCEIGCGGGDNLKAIARYCESMNISARFTGIDLKKACLEFAEEQYPALGASWICSDYMLVSFNNEIPDIIFSSLFCHHFNNDELIKQMQWLKRNCKSGFFINDLHRHPLAFYSIKWLTALFSRSYMVKNDAPISVARGFRRNEWIKLLNGFPEHTFSIQWKWAFRHLITFIHG